MAKSPATLGLREGVIKVRDKGAIGEMEGARGGVGHDIVVSWDERELGAVAVVALVFAGALAQVGCGPGCGCGAFVHS